MVLHTRVCDILNITHPVIQGGMHFVAYSSLSAAVSNAGGLGIITALTQPSPEHLRAEIQKLKALLRTPNVPFGVNMTLLPTLAPPNYDAYLDVIIEERVPVVETAGRNPSAIIKRLKSAGITVIHKCVNIKHALTAERLGVDIIAMDGFECAGHPGDDDIPNMILLPRAKEALKIPFIASGGIGTGSQLAACLALGAEGINMGTRFMATREAPIHDGIKSALVSGTELSTTHVMKSLKNTERVYKNSASKQVQELEAKHPGDINAIRHLVRGENYRRSFQETGNADDSVWSAGMVMGLIHDVPTVAVLIERIVADAENVIQALPTRVVASGAYPTPTSKL